ncbi:MAG: phospho-N-acetylmuramoyl-pentapeptide-transferase [Gemmatimonadaceae bacterium]|nr:phospho-N-acetylmuramoyl-pentapeptide-transferase [Gloeobacterales cyanobacterium ES-bin-141]
MQPVVAPRPAVPVGWRTALVLGLALVTVVWVWGRPLVSPFAVAFAMSAGTGFLAVPLLRRLKAGQVIRTDGPQSHLQKAGTPTMGGAFFLPWALLVPLAFFGLNTDLLAAIALGGACGLVGLLDDWRVIRPKANRRGITALQKMILLVAIGTLFCGYLFAGGRASVVGLGDIGVLFWPLALFVLTGSTNAVNLTDGLDALAGGTGAIASAALGLIVLAAHPALACLCFSLSGACLGFLVHNRHKADVFMGDTGSLAIGGILAAVALLSGQVIALALVGGVFVLEALSVIAQVGYYKATKGPDGKGKRLLRMAPLHHHFELGGLHETQVVGRFYLAGAVLAVLAVWLCRAS